jgi:hypothetical protein
MMFEKAAQDGARANTSPLRALDATFMKCALSSLVGNCSEKERLIGKTKGGWNSKATFLVDEDGRVRDWCMSPGNRHDQKAAMDLTQLEVGLLINADKGFDSRPFRNWLRERGCRSNIAQKCTSEVDLSFSPELYKHTNGGTSSRMSSITPSGGIQSPSVASATPITPKPS